MSGVSLHGGLERPLCKAMKVKPGLPWRLQDVRDATVRRYGSTKAADRVKIAQDREVV